MNYIATAFTDQLGGIATEIGLPDPSSVKGNVETVFSRSSSSSHGGESPQQSGIGTSSPTTQIKLLISGMSAITTEQDLRDYFDPFCKVIEAVIMPGTAAGLCSKGFITISDSRAADEISDPSVSHSIRGTKVQVRRVLQLQKVGEEKNAPSEMGTSKRAKEPPSAWFRGEGTKGPGDEADTLTVMSESPFPNSRIAPRPGALQEETAASESDTVTPQIMNVRREVSKSTLNSLLHLIVTILRNSGGELKATDGSNCLKSILQRDMPSAIKDISDAGGLTRFCEIHSAYLEFISDGCGSGNIRLKNKGKAGLPVQVFGTAPGSGLTQIYNGDNSMLRMGDISTGTVTSQVFGCDSVVSKTPALPGGLYGDWSPNVLSDKVPSSPASVAPRLHNGDEPAPKTWTLWGHGAPLQSLATRQDNAADSGGVARGVHGPFSIVVKDDTLEGNGLTNGLVEGATNRVSSSSSVIISAAGIRGPDEDDCEVQLQVDGIKSLGSAAECSSPGQLSLLSAGNHFGAAAMQPTGQSPRQPRRLEAFAQMSERQAYEAFGTSGLSHSASAFNPGSGSLGMMDESNDLDLAKSRFRDGLRAFASVRGENDVVLPMRASPGTGVAAFDDRGLGMSDISLPFAANASGSEAHKPSFLLSDFERPAGMYGATNSMNHFIKDLDNIDGAGGSDSAQEVEGSHDYLGGDKNVVGGYMPDEISGYFSSLGLGAQRKVLRPPGTDMFLMDPHALPDGLAPWSGVDGNFPAATYLDKSGTPQNIAEFREGIGRVLLEKLVDILRQESGELLASLAPDKLYTSVARGKEEITAVGGLRKFCLLYPADLEFIADTGGRCRIRLRRSSTFDVPSWPLQDGLTDAAKTVTRDGRRRDEGGADGNGTPTGGGEGGSEEPRKPEVRRTAAVERLVGILRAEGGDMSATQATSKLYKALPRAKEDVVAAGGLRKFCELFPTDLEFVADLQGRCRIRARRATKGSRGSGRAERAAKEAQGDSKASSRSSSTARPASQSGQAAVQCSVAGNLNSSISIGGDSIISAAVAGNNSIVGGAIGQPGDVALMMPISREATTTLQRLVGILRGEGGEMYAARAPEVLYRAYPRARDVLAASGGFQRFCSMFPAELEFLAQKGGGRDKVRLAKGRGGDARRRGGGSSATGATQGGVATSIIGSPATAAVNGGRIGDGAGRGGGGRGASTAGGVAEGLVALLRAEPGGSMPAAHASRRLCALVPGAEREIAAAGGFRRFCSMFPGLVGVDTDGGGRGTVFLRAGGGGVGSGLPAPGGGMPGQFWGEATPLLPLPPPATALGARGSFQPWQPPPGTDAYEPHQVGWGDGPALWARPHPGVNSWSPSSGGGGGGGGGVLGSSSSGAEGLQPMGGLVGAGRSAGGACGACGDGQAESRLVPCGHCVCRQCAHVMVMVMMVANQRNPVQQPAASCPLCRRDVGHVEPLHHRQQPPGQVPPSYATVGESRSPSGLCQVSTS